MLEGFWRQGERHQRDERIYNLLTSNLGLSKLNSLRRMYLF